MKDDNNFKRIESNAQMPVQTNQTNKKTGKKQILLPPVMISIATLAGIIIMQLSPPVLDICLKDHNVETFSKYPVIQIFEDNKQKFLPERIDKELKEKKNVCI
jgi:hypothetical protein